MLVDVNLLKTGKCEYKIASAGIISNAKTIIKD